MNKKINKLLARQIRRKLGSEENIPDDIWELLMAVSQSYNHYERDRKLLERAMEISSTELRASYERLFVQTELERQNKDLQQFVAIASHDLKAPLRNINTLAMMLENELGEQVSERSTEYLQLIKEGVKGMDALIRNLLEFAKLGMHSNNKFPTDLNQVLEIVKRNLRNQIKEANATIEVCSLPTIETYPSQMLQLFQNLIGNSLKFKRPEATPKVNVCCEEKNNTYIFSIRDNGIGITPQEQQKVFEVFQRTDNSNGIEGSGLGLSICKKIVEASHGKIWLESEPGVGSIFFFSIPLSNGNDSTINNAKHGQSVFSSQSPLDKK